MHTDRLQSEKPVTQGAAEILVKVQQEVGDWSKWLKRLKTGKKRVPIRKLLSPSTLYWGMPTEQVIHQATIARLLQLKTTASKRQDEFDWREAAQQWIAAMKEGLSSQSALEGLAWAHAMPALARNLPERDWHQLLATLLLVSQPGAAALDDEAILRFLMHCELPMALAYSLPELSICKEKATAARNEFAESLDRLLDGEGMPHATHLGSIQLLLASCTRVLKLDAEVKKGRVDKAARLQYDWLSRQTLRWSRPDGTTIFGDATDTPYFDELFRAALRLTKDESDVTVHELLRGKRKSAGEDVPAASEHSEWSEAATLRTTWLPNAARLAVKFPRNSLSCELAVSRQVIFSGDVMPSITVDGKRLSVESDWEEVCWETDNDMDYIELECHLSSGWRVQRQFLLARKDLFALVSDVVLGPQTSDIKYKHTLPLVDGILLEQAEETTEAMILGNKRLGMVIPLSLSEWQTGQRENRLRPDPARLEIGVRARSLYAPLFIDLDPTRRSKSITWRQLTVAEELQPVTPEVAVAYRVQIGKKQWVIYRSLDKPGNRSFIGLNVISEFIVARFKSDGEIEALIEISA